MQRETFLIYRRKVLRVNALPQYIIFVKHFRKM